MGGRATIERLRHHRSPASAAGGRRRRAARRRSSPAPSSTRQAAAAERTPGARLARSGAGASRPRAATVAPRCRVQGAHGDPRRPPDRLARGAPAGVVRVARSRRPASGRTRVVAARARARGSVARPPLPRAGSRGGPARRAAGPPRARLRRPVSRRRPPPAGAPPPVRPASPGRPRRARPAVRGPAGGPRPAVRRTAARRRPRRRPPSARGPGAPPPSPPPSPGHALSRSRPPSPPQPLPAADPAQPPPRPDRTVGASPRSCSGRPRPGRPTVTPELRDELADCLVYLVALSDALGVDLVDDAVTRLRSAVESAHAVSGERPLPSLRTTATGTQLIVDGRPVLLLGGQLHNSSPSSPAYMQPIWDRLAGMGIRTVIGAASWAQVEPAEGTFDFSTVDAQIEQARSRGMRLVLIWFGAFKNAASTYAPGGCARTPAASPGRSRRHGQGAVHLPGRHAEAGAHGVLPGPARRRPPGVRPVHGAPGRRRPGPHRRDGPGRERGGPPPRQPRPVARGRGGVAQRRCRRR